MRHGLSAIFIVLLVTLNLGANCLRYRRALRAGDVVLPRALQWKIGGQCAFLATWLAVFTLDGPSGRAWGWGLLAGLVTSLLALSRGYYLENVSTKHPARREQKSEAFGPDAEQ